eukprot:2513685-Rhodomonas_salina.2
MPQHGQRGIEGVVTCAYLPSSWHHTHTSLYESRYARDTKTMTKLATSMAWFQNARFQRRTAQSERVG